MPPDVSPEQMRDDLLTQLYENRHELKGIALVQGIKALRDLVPPEPPPPPKEDDRINLLEKMDSLPKGRARNLIRQAIARLRFDLAQHEQALAKLEGVKRGDTDPV